MFVKPTLCKSAEDTHCVNFQLLGSKFSLKWDRCASLEVASSNFSCWPKSLCHVCMEPVILYILCAVDRIYPLEQNHHFKRSFIIL